jgi:hypothetical protein
LRRFEKVAVLNRTATGQFPKTRYLDPKPLPPKASRGLDLFDPMEDRVQLYQQMSKWAAIGVAIGILGIFLLEIFAVLAWG